MKRLLVILGSVALMLLALQTFLPAQAQVGLVESRLARVESELAGIRSQLSQLSALRPSPGVAVPAPRTALPPQRPTKFTDAQFDRLATLVIESRDRIEALEAKVAQLERR
jgi:outer membrane protein TolC